MKKSALILSSLFSLLWLSGTEVLAEKKSALKAIDPSQANYDTPPPAPNSVNNAPAPLPANPYGGGIQGQPLAAPKRTLDNPNPQGPSVLREDTPPGIPTQAGQGWSPPSQPVDNAIYEQRISRLEQLTFGSPYPEHEVEDRLDHLENEVFSKKNTGVPVDQRVARLESKLLGQTAFGQASAPTGPPVGPGPSNPNQYGSSGPSQSSGYYGVTQAPQFNPGQYQPQQQPQQQPYGQQGSYNQGPPNDPYSRMPANQNPYSGFPQYQNRPQYGGQGGYQNTAPQMGTQGYPPRQSYPNQSPQQGYQGAPQMGYQGQPRTGAQGYQQNPSSQAGGQGYQSPPQMGSQLPPPQMGSQGFQNPSAQQQQTPAPVNVGSASPAPAGNIASAQNSGKPPEPPRAGSNSEMDNIVKSIPSKPSVGDYFASISRFSSGTVARWKSFPVLVHLPEGSPATWHGALKDAVESWGRYIPIRVAAVSEAADIEIGWINHLPPRALGQTNLEVFNGRMRVTVYLLRPSYYLPNVSQKVLRKVAEHEVGHALGIFGHSNDPYDLMFPIENLDTKEGTKYGAISPRDLNTLRRIYESPSLPSNYQSPHPMGWSLNRKN